MSENSNIIDVTETEFNYADGEDIPSVNFSEKTFKAMLGMHPFFVLSQPKALWSLQQLGFKTFSDYWNEDYDLIQEDDRISIIGLADFTPGQPLMLEALHSDGSKDVFPVHHTYNEAQIQWFKAGSALNEIRANQ